RSAADHHPLRRHAARHGRIPRPASDHDAAGRVARAARPAAPVHRERGARQGLHAGGERARERGAPARPVDRRGPAAVPVVLDAAVFCSLGFEVAKRLYALYVTRFATLDRVASDANIVALFLFLLWVYYTAYLFLLGGEVAEMYDLVRMRRSQRVQLG